MIYIECKEGDFVFMGKKEDIQRMCNQEHLTLFNWTKNPKKFVNYRFLFWRLESVTCESQLYQYHLWGDLPTIDKSTILEFGFEYNANQEIPTSYSVLRWSKSNPDSGEFNSKQEMIKSWESTKKKALLY